MRRDEETRKCVHCGEVKPLSQFYRKGNGYQSRCKECDKAHGKDKRRDSEGNNYYITNTTDDNDMKEIEIFESGEFGQVRTAKDQNEEPMFCLKDVCNVLGIRNHNEIASKLGDGVVSIYPIHDSLGRIQKTTFINEDGLYDVILDSRKPEARAFRKWITSSVIPSIRKNGAYVANQETLSPEEIIRRGYEAITKICEAQRAQLEAQKPKVEYFNALIERDLLTSITDTAKELGIVRKNFIAWLTQKGLIFHDQKGKIKPSHIAVSEGLMTLKEIACQHNAYSGLQCLITPKGRATFNRLLCGNQSA